MHWQDVLNDFFSGHFGSINLSGIGVRAADISIADRFPHSQFCLCDFAW